MSPFYSFSFFFFWKVVSLWLNRLLWRMLVLMFVLLSLGHFKLKVKLPSSWWQKDVRTVVLYVLIIVSILVNGVALFPGFVSCENRERNHLCFSFPLSSAMTAVIAISVSVATVFLVLLSIVICVWWVTGCMNRCTHTHTHTHTHTFLCSSLLSPSLIPVPPPRSVPLFTFFPPICFRMSCGVQENFIWWLLRPNATTHNAITNALWQKTLWIRL